MQWEYLMGYAPHTATFDAHLKLGEGFGWGTLLLSLAAGLKGLGVLVGAITPDLINPWLILVASTITGAVAVGTLAYSRIQRSKLDGEQLEAIYKANIQDINAGRPVRWPAFLPKGAVTVTTTTIVDMTNPKPPEIKP